MDVIQKKKIEVWSKERDDLLNDIRILIIDKESQLSLNKEAALEYTDLMKSISKAKGNLEELVGFEDRMRSSVSNDIVSLIAQKSRLEGEISGIKEEILSFDGYVKEKMNNLQALTLVHETILKDIHGIKEVVGSVSEKGSKHLSDIKGLTSNLVESIENLIKKSDENVKQTGIVLEKLPKYIFEMSKPMPLRRVKMEPRKDVQSNP